MRKIRLQVFQQDRLGVTKRGLGRNRLRDYGFWYWRLRAGNGRVIADGAEGYARKDAVVRAAWTTVRLIRRAVVSVV